MHIILIEKVPSPLNFDEIEMLDEEGWRTNSLFDYRVVRGFVLARYVSESDVHYAVAADLDTATGALLDELKN